MSFTSPDASPSVTPGCQKPMPLFPLAFASLAIVFAAGGTEIRAQTFVQLTDLGSNMGPRLTRAVARQRINRSLFGSIGTKVSFINNGTVYQFAGDPEWSRILVGLKDQWIHQYDNQWGPGGRLLQPLGIDISARKYFYAADRGKGLILFAEFSPSAENLINPGTWTSPEFPNPTDVAWDGRTTPLTTDYLYVLDDSLSRVTYWDRPTLLWSYGVPGSGVGQFSRPSGICLGKTAAANGGTQFTTYFYVVDRGNRRVVWLNRGANAPSWLSTTTLPDWDPTDCAVDHFGNVYVVDEINHRLHKFTYSLTLLATYGTYGTGPANYDTFAWPHAISVPCGLKVVNSQTVWYCEGRVITAEQWSDSSGAVEHYLGIDAWITGGPTVGPDWASFVYNVTDHATHSVDVAGTDLISVRHIASGALMGPGEMGWYWDGRRDDGSIAPSGDYVFRARVQSAYGGGQPWANKSLLSQTFFFSYTAPPPCKPACAPPAEADGGEPTTLFLRQRVLTAPQPLARVQGAAAAAPAERIETGSGMLTSLVRQYGVRGLSFGVTREASASPVLIRVYSLSGRPVRTLASERLEPGVYEIGWDGLDDRGRPAGPGVYFAVLTAGGQRLVQRLILRQAP